MARKYNNVSTKVAPEVKEQLKRILADAGLNEYQWFQAMAEVTVRLMDDRHNLSESMAKMIQMMRLVPGFTNPMTFADASVNPEIREAIYIVSDKAKKGSKPVMVSKNWFDETWSETQNVKMIVERIIEICMPDSYRRLRACMQELECSSVFECLMTLVDAHELVKLEEEVPDMMEEMRGFHPFGRKVEYGERTKRKHHITPDTMRKPKKENHDKSN